MAVKNAALRNSLRGENSNGENPNKDEQTTKQPTAHPERAAARIDRIVHERLRLGILSALAVNESLTFNELKKLMETTDGNLSVHARKLEEAGYVSCVKSFDGRMPRTEYKMTVPGRRALEKYLDHMESLIRATRQV